jgi:hypothetical protein
LNEILKNNDKDFYINYLHIFLNFIIIKKRIIIVLLITLYFFIHMNLYINITLLLICYKFIP